MGEVGGDGGGDLPQQILPAPVKSKEGNKGFFSPSFAEVNSDVEAGVGGLFCCWRLSQQQCCGAGAAPFS